MLRYVVMLLSAVSSLGAATAQMPADDDHAAIKALLEAGAIPFKPAVPQHVAQWVIASSGCQTFIHRLDEERGGSSVLNTEIRWDKQAPLVAQGNAVRVKAEKLYGDYLDLYARSNESAVELARRMNSLRARCASGSGELRPWPINHDDPRVPPGQRFDFNGTESCRLAAAPQATLYSGTLIEAARAWEDDRVVATLNLGAPTVPGQPFDTFEVSIAINPAGMEFDTGIHFPRSGNFRATATLDGKPLGGEWIGEYAGAGDPWTVEPAQNASALSERLLAGGTLALTLKAGGEGGVAKTFTFRLDQGVLAAVQAAGWRCRST